MPNLKFSVNLKNAWYKIHENLMVSPTALHAHARHNMEILEPGYVEKKIEHKIKLWMTKIIYSTIHNQSVLNCRRYG